MLSLLYTQGADAMWSAVSDVECGSAAGSIEGGELTSEQLWGSMRVDSYFAPRLLPPTRVAMRLAALNIYLHNDMPTLNEYVFFALKILCCKVF